MIDQIVDVVVEKTGLPREQAQAAATAVLDFVGEKLPAVKALLGDAAGEAGDAAAGAGDAAQDAAGGLMDKAKGALGL